MAALQEDTPDISLCKSVLLALGRVLAAQSSDSWSSESVRHTYRIFLQFVDHENPTIRKTCQMAVLEILTSSLSQEGIHHPVCHQTVSHLCTLIRQKRNHLSTLIRTTDESFGGLLRCLNLLKSALPLVPEKDVKAGCECALELTEIPNSLVLKATFECLQAVFSGCAKEDSLPLEMAAKLMSALFTCRPQEPTAVESVALQKETDSMTCWLHCLRDGVAFLTTFILNSATTNPDLAINVAIEHLEHLIKVTLIIVVDTPVPRLRDAARDVILTLFADQLNTQLQHGGLLDRRPRLLPELCLTIQKAIKVMRVGARQLVPSILSLYEEQESTNDQQLKQQLRATLIAFFPLLGSKMLSVPCEMAFKKLTSTGRPIYMEIIQFIIPHLAEENIKSLLLGLEVYLTPENKFPALRKPSYRVFEAVLSSNQAEAEVFVRHNLTSLISLMGKVAPKVNTPDPLTKNPDLCSNMAELTVSTGPLHKSAKASGITPWKSRLRILRCLLRALTVELFAEENSPKTTMAPEIEGFLNMFLPEVLPQFNHLNNVVRILAGRLLVDMVRASAGLSLADERAAAVSASRNFSSGTSDCGTLAASKMDADDEDATSSDAASHAPTEIASINSAMTIAGMEPALAAKVCSALQAVLTRLWPSILELSTDQLKQSPAYATQLVAITKSVVRLLGDTFLRRALLTDLDGQVVSEEDGDSMDQQSSPVAAQILAAANSASRALVSCPNCSLARLGLRLSRLLVAFIGRSVYVSDIVVNIQSVHDSHKRPLRFVVKALVEKLLRKAR
nr:unnamed protein product [Spirometra erinaceieuropaei]